MGRGEMNQDPVQDDYFNTAALDSYSDALVREAIQNSLDAKIKALRIPFVSESRFRTQPVSLLPKTLKHI